MTSELSDGWGVQHICSSVLDCNVTPRIMNHVVFFVSLYFITMHQHENSIKGEQTQTHTQIHIYIVCKQISKTVCNNLQICKMCLIRCLVNCKASHSTQFLLYLAKQSKSNAIDIDFFLLSSIVSHQSKLLHF